MFSYCRHCFIRHEDGRWLQKSVLLTTHPKKMCNQNKTHIQITVLDSHMKIKKRKQDEPNRLFKKNLQHESDFGCRLWQSTTFSLVRERVCSDSEKLHTFTIYTRDTSTRNRTYIHTTLYADDRTQTQQAHVFTYYTTNSQYIDKWIKQNWTSWRVICKSRTEEWNENMDSLDTMIVYPIAKRKIEGEREREKKRDSCWTGKW